MTQRKTAQRVALALLMGVMALASSLFILHSSSTSIRQSVKKIARESMMRTGTYVSAWLDQKETVIDSVGKAIVNLEGHEKALMPYLHDIASGDSNILDIYFATDTPPQEGGRFYSGRDLTAYALENLDGYQWTERPWFRLARESGETVVTPPYWDTSTETQEDTVVPLMMVSISRPIFRNGEFIGVLAMDIVMDQLRKSIDSAALYDNAALNLIRRDGKYITHADTDKILATGLYEDYEHLEEFRERVSSGDFFFHTRGDNFFASINVPGTDWLIMETGEISVFYDNAALLLSLAGVLMLLMAMFLVLLVRSWRSRTKLAEAKDTIDEHNRSLEATIAERTAWLQNILDNTGQGFFTFGSDFIIDPEYSRGCVDILGRDIEGEPVTGLLFPSKPEVAKEFTQGFRLFFDGQTKAEIIIDLTEKRTILNEKILAVDYKAITPQKILCILTDVTLQTEFEEKNRKEAQRHAKLLAAINHKHSFAKFMLEAEALFSVLELYLQKEPDEREMERLQHELHTFKGNSGFFAFRETQNAAHEAETVLTDSLTLGEPISFREIDLQLKKPFYRELKTITDTMGESWLDEAGGILIPHEAYQKILTYVEKRLPEETKLAHYLLYYKKVPFKELFSRLPFAAEAAAERLGKKVKPMKIVGGDQRVLPDPFYAFAESLIHLVNNMVDHGIEYPYEREAVQKMPEGQLELYIGISKTHITMEFKDDGRGVNTKAVEKAARDKGWLEEGRKYTQQELLQMIFKSSFSTRSQADTTSGRGIGLSAVAEEVTQLGGAIEVQSRLGKGTVFEITLPIKNH